ncbi:MAG TPA: response regulator transcription factor [Chloroflexi bacterium]|jgi:RNA polymerase sigma factor (sigma-70 family)|nr:response regulator transcription factor [Chloroflexota bacterium]
MTTSISVFLADDHAVVRDGLRLLLGIHGDIEVVGDAANGREAVAKVAQMCPDIVILDIAMPELNGLEAAQQIRDLCPSTQVIILSMYSTSEHVFRALEAGARGYLLKESAGTEVADAVRSVYNGRLYLSPTIADLVVDDYLQQQNRESRSPLSRLSPREREVLQLVVEGKTNAEVAEILAFSVKTVETYRSRIMRKLGLSDLPSLVKFAIQHGITPPQ